MTVMVNLLVMLGILVLMPLGLRLIPWSGVSLVVRLWPWPALLASVALWLPRGAVATALVLPYAVMTAALVLVAASQFQAHLDPGRLAVLTALVTPSVAATALVAERAGYRLFGFSLTVLALTVPHLHYAGFAAALVAGLLYARLAAGASRRLPLIAALAIPAGTGLVMLGHFLGEWPQLAGAIVLTTGMWAAAWLTWFELRPIAPNRVAGALFAVSSLVLAVTMLLAVAWSLGRAAGLPHLSLTWMVATHGIANALGFATCGLLAWHAMLQRDLPGPDVRQQGASGDDLQRSADAQHI